MHSTGKQEIGISDFKMGRPNWEQPNIPSWEVIVSWVVTSVPTNDQLNLFLACGDFCRLLIIFAKSLNPILIWI